MTPQAQPRISVLFAGTCEPRKICHVQHFEHNRSRLCWGICMIAGIGIDLVETGRVTRELSRAQWKEDDGVFGAAEIGYCNAARRPAQTYAGCFAAKEATLKALGAEITDLGIFREVEVRLGSLSTHAAIVLRNRLEVVAAELEVKRIHLSLATHRKTVAAMVILEC